MNLQETLFHDWSTAVYVISWSPWLKFWGDWKLEVTLGVSPELSVATGLVHFTSAENVPFSAYDSNELLGHDTPYDNTWESKESNNDNGLISKLRCFLQLAPPTPAPDRQQEDLVLVLERAHRVNNHSNNNNYKSYNQTNNFNSNFNCKLKLNYSSQEKNNEADEESFSSMVKIRSTSTFHGLCVLKKVDFSEKETTAEEKLSSHVKID